MSKVKCENCEKLDAMIVELTGKVKALESKSKGRKGEVLNVIQEAGEISIEAIGSRVGIESKNVSSVLSGLRNEGNVFLSFRVGKENLISWIGCQVDGKLLNSDNVEVDMRGAVKK